MRCQGDCRKVTSRLGFTLTEILVSIGIIGLLIAVLVPAVQSSREAARGVTCRSHLKQLVLATTQYESSWKTVPGAVWFRQLDADLEGKISSSESFMACPSDPLADRADLHSFERSYQMNDGTLPGVDHNGFLAGDYGTYLSEFTDGLSQTACFAERLVEPPTDQYMNPSANPQLWNRLLRRISNVPTGEEEFVNMCQNFPLPPLPGGFSPNGYHHVIIPNGNSCFYGPFVGGSSEPYHRAAFTSSSFHPSHINVAIADGSVRIVSSSISRPIWRALGTRQDGEVVGAF